MIKIIFLSFFLVTYNGLLAQNNVEIKAKPEVSLTLIPPSPVTDQIILDIRAGVRNEGHSPKSFQAAFYLDEEKKASLLKQFTISVNPQTAKAVKFRWPTKNKAVSVCLA